MKSEMVAKKLAKWHKSNWISHPTPRLFNTLWKWFNGVPTTYSREQVQQKFESKINMKYIKKELISLEKLLVQFDSPVVFCHNDLLSGNIIFKGHEVDFIDYEYGNYNFRGFDIANHFCEYAGFDCDFSKYPSKEFQIKWLATYLQEFNSTGTAEELQAFYKEVSTFSLAAHFFWGLWALIQAQYSDISFDYMSYSIMRFDEFEKAKLLLNNKS